MPANNYTLDDLDFTILKQLQQDARRPYSQIAQELGVPLGTIRNRVMRMVDNNIVRFWSRIAPHRVGFKTPANIHIAVQPSELLEDVATQIADFPEVSYIAMMTGDYDLEVDVWCRDLEHLTELLTHRLQKIKGISTTKTALVLKVIKIANPDIELIKPT
jgi:Lrp/AsnC family transcriptional regulator, regulator for asnA, asnC and gidA